MALTEDIQELVWMALLFRAIETSGESVWWACLTLTRWHNLLSWGAQLWSAIEWVGLHDFLESWAILAMSIWKNSLSLVAAVLDTSSVKLRNLVNSAIVHLLET